MWLTLVFVVTTALFLWMTSSALFHLQWVQRLPALTDFDTVAVGEKINDAAVHCTVVIAARDEESRIAHSIRNLLAQRDVTLEVIVVNDRSIDRTEKILRELTLQDGRVHTQRVDELPNGWLGKCYACHVGAAVAKGEWILFTDADCWIEPDVIARALRVAIRDKADHVTLTPGVTAGTVGAQAWHLAFLISLSNWISGVNRDRPKAHLGLGAFNLVRAAAYRQCGGYESLRMTVLDDVRLGLLLCRAGKRTRAFIGGDDVECHWGTTVADQIKIHEKNYFAAMNFQLIGALAAGFGGLLFWCIAILGLISGTAAGLASGLAMFSLCVPAYILSWRLGWNGPCWLLTPLVFPLLFYAVLRSAWVTTRRGGVLWRDTFYPLDALRQGGVR